MIDALPFLLAGLVFGALITALIFQRRLNHVEKQNTELTAQIKHEKASLERTTAELDNRFKLTAQEALQKSSEQFLQLAESKLKASQSDSDHDLDKRQKAIDALVKPVQEQLAGLGKAVEQIKGTDEALRMDLRALSSETAKLVGALRDPNAQGLWGEYILEGLLEKSGLMKGIHYETQVHLDDGRKRPDAVIQMQNGFHIIIDAKAPINEFTQRLSETLSQEDEKAVMQGLAKQVKSHVQKLGSKGYWENLESPDFTVLFLPSEHLYSLALRAEPALIEYAAERNIIIASPTLLMSLLRVVGMSWRQAELAKNAGEISELGGELYKRLLTFTTHIEKVGKNLQTAMNGYDAAIGSLEKSVLPSARKMHELQGKNPSDLPEIEAIERTPRILSLTEEDEQAKKLA